MNLPGGRRATDVRTRRVIPTVAVAVAVALVACTISAPPGPRRGTTSPNASASAGLTREQRWAEDIQDLVRRMRALHPDLYHGISPRSFGAAVDSLVSELPTLTDDQILVGLMHLVALISSRGRDGHMGIWPPDNPRFVRRYPIRVWEFPDGLYVTAARAPNEDLVGTRVVSVNGLPIDEALRRLDPVVPRDNHSNLRPARAVFLTSAEVLSGLGLAREPSSLELGVEARDGLLRTAEIPAVAANTYEHWVRGWELLLPPRGNLRFLRRPDAHFWVSYLPSSHAVYVQYRVVDERSGDVVDAIRTSMANHRVARLVLDLRTNGGGEAGGYRELLRFATSGRIDRPGRLYVLVGRLTFSAAASLTVLLDRRADHVVIVGEDTGGAPNFWADPAQITLPNSTLRALVSTRYFGLAGPNDERLTIDPDVRVPFRSTDYFAGVDPVLTAALKLGRSS
jgi:hypothetical protein